MGARLARDTPGERLPRFLALGTAAASLLALSLGLAGWVSSAFALAALAVMLFAMEGVVRRVTTAGQVRPRVPVIVQILTVLIDPLLVLLVALASPEDTQWLRLFVPAILVGLLHLGERVSAARWRRSYADRVLLVSILLPAVLPGVVQPVVAVLALAVLISIFMTSDPRN
tara:strand:- start:237 stop:749 length:513 start_codon:yes stop_codon:yes gene_type:complete